MRVETSVYFSEYGRGTPAIEFEISALDNENNGSVATIFFLSVEDAKRLRRAIKYALKRANVA